MLIEVSKKNKKPELSLTVDADVEINVPFERKITSEKNEDIEYQSIPEQEPLSIEDFGTLEKVYGQVAIDRKLLEQNIHQALEGNSQITLADVVEQHPLRQGLPELFAYFAVLSHYPHKTINDEKRCAVVFDRENYKLIRIPEIIISR